MTTLAKGADAAGLVPPPNGAGRERVEQDPSQLAPLHLGASARAVVGVVEQDGSAPVEDPCRLAALQDEAAEVVDQACRPECRLAVVVVDVEHPALRARRRGGLRLVERGRDSVDVQDTGEREAAQPGADDRVGSIGSVGRGHDASFLIADRWTDTRRITPGTSFQQPQSGTAFH